MKDVGLYAANIKTLAGIIEVAWLTPALMEDMPRNWNFAWPELWLITDNNYQSIVKMTLHGELLGLVRYSLFSTEVDGPIDQLFVEQLESNPIFRSDKPDRKVKPVGMWCFWYAAKVGLQFCADTGPEQELVTLASLEEAVDYYRDVIQMKYVGTAPGAPGEDLYVFTLSRRATEEYCLRLQPTER
jgi:hypothetical protein